jgi:hypothetical protein
MQLMCARRITNHDCRVILDLDFTIFWIVARVTWLALAPIVVTHNIFGSLSGCWGRGPKAPHEKFPQRHRTYYVLQALTHRSIFVLHDFQQANENNVYDGGL